MTSTNIYSQKLNPTKAFKPTYLYIKQHTLTGKLYFGKTTTDPENYRGSGDYWRRHINKHGKKHVETLWYCLFYDLEECVEFALMFSEQQNIVESTDWLNLKIENGLDGKPPGIPTGPNGRKGIPNGPNGRKGIPKSDETKYKMSLAKLGVSKSEEHKLNMSIAAKKRYSPL